MWREYRRNYFDRHIREFKNIHDWAVSTNFITLIICMILGPSICALTKQKYPKLIGQTYLICGIISLIIIAVHTALDIRRLQEWLLLKMPK